MRGGSSENGVGGQYLLEKIIQVQGNMKESWRTIKQLLNKRSKSTDIELMSGKGTEIITKKEISNAMRKYSVLEVVISQEILINLQILYF